MSRVCVITGINGQLGQYFAKYLQENEPEIKLVGTIRHKSYDNQEYLFDKELVSFELMDLSDVHSIENLIIKYKPDYFFNFAANPIVSESWKLPAQQVEVNFLAVIHQLEAIRKHSPLTKYFSCGTSEEFAYTNEKLNEESNIAPHSPYGVCKVASRYIIDVYRQSYGIYALQDWLFNFESKIRGEKYLTRKVTTNVARIYHSIINGKKFEPLKIGNMASVRSFQHCSDVVEGIWRTMNQEFYRKELVYVLGNIIDNSFYSWEKDIISEIKPYVLSSNNLYSIKQFIEEAFKAAGFKGYWEGFELNERYYITDLCINDEINYQWTCNNEKIIGVCVDQKFFRPLDVKLLHGDSNKALQEIGWETKISFDEIVREMVDFDIRNYGNISRNIPARNS